MALQNSYSKGHNPRAVSFDVYPQHNILLDENEDWLLDDDDIE